MLQMTSIVLVNGKNKSNISVFNRTNQFGDGIFETILVKNNRILFWNEHFARLEKGRIKLKIDNVSEKIWLKDITKLVAISRLDKAIVKIILSRGESQRGYGFDNNVKPVRIAIIFPMAENLLPEYNLTICNSGYATNPLLSNIKHCNRLEQILARVNINDGEECIMRDDKHNVISVTQGNIFAVKNGELLTPNLDNCGICGTRRAVVLDIANSLKLKTYIKDITLNQLLQCDEVFITNSLIGIKPVNKINDCLFNEHTITEKINEKFLNLQNLRKRSKKIKPKKRFIFLTLKQHILFLLLILLFIWIYFFKNVSVNNNIVYQLPKNSNISQVTKELYDFGYINSTKYSMLLARLLNLEDKLKHGYYDISPNMRIDTLFNNFASAKVATRNVALIEGKTIDYYFQQLSQNKALKTNSSFEQIMGKLGIKNPYEGYFWPDTYRFNYGDSVYSILERSHKIMLKKLDFAWKNRQPNPNIKTPYDALILASLIEKETANNAEKAKIAGVFLSRLAKGMRLQTDPTVIYALGKNYKGKLTLKDLKVDSPYNTYKNKGLPPSPISSVGGKSLEAALNPDIGNYLYFSSKKDGSHAFATDYEQHLANVKKYLKNNK
jgi:aminodeoxychorismate lyase